MVLITGFLEKQTSLEWNVIKCAVQTRGVTFSLLDCVFMDN